MVVGGGGEIEVGGLVGGVDGFWGREGDDCGWKV